jgi:YD repeat-containing protein
MALGDDGGVRTVKEEAGPHHTRYEYDYDARGNWTRRIVSWRSEAGVEFQRSNVERRAITYY